ncbi:MAG TPA: hypothetical protein DEQ87_01850 [Algoriphagus sp.]|jgi:transcription elongation GreA/GreB family factor|uniref:hypothetical protein n=1 Tax=unclassified Algoriphagus TaxID=2641541 RepID=UPI000C4BDE54|nr:MULTISPECIES: hypothetical protein [unclassified Algoriphagus]MAL13111.1 hypothetical protein [Algoriphagus sp.]MAN87302.1 hypothetical protein [Algoriphagus sp.]QYH41050.1 hypothetical protein GYM62_20435 [Algoriphagus sp. NBT04N3]HAD51856.1 hypothetical protein [Algoriphagus sp.]HAH36301.1 hypothetical protein [Algoriphagus sp.]|tara:strand:+ start:1910 stop:2365 length:456 start_codon:yes stop_codon:yes gene_type:complete
MQELKEKIFQAAIRQLKEKISLLQQERKAVSEGILEDTKSSAGDKFETGREMMTQDLKTIEGTIEKLQEDLDEIYRVQSIKSNSEAVREGSLIQLGTDFFLISASIGQLEVEGKKYFLLSRNSPLGQVLIGKKKGENVLFRGKPQAILDVQ